MSSLTKRFAAILACLAVIGTADTARLRLDVVRAGVSVVMAYGGAGSTPAELGAGRAAARLFASTREQRPFSADPAAGVSRAVEARLDRGVRVDDVPATALSQTPRHPRGERGPPSYVRS